jgi:hypothetical protein
MGHYSWSLLSQRQHSQQDKILRHVWDCNKGVHGKKTNKKGLKIYQTEHETMDGDKVLQTAVMHMIEEH